MDNSLALTIPKPLSVEIRVGGSLVIPESFKASLLSILEASSLCFTRFKTTRPDEWKLIEATFEVAPSPECSVENCLTKLEQALSELKSQCPHAIVCYLRQQEAELGVPAPADCYQGLVSRPASKKAANRIVLRKRWRSL